MGWSTLKAMVQKLNILGTEGQELSSCGENSTNESKATLFGSATVYCVFFNFHAHFSASTFMDVKSQYEMSAANTTCKSMKKNHVCKSMQN